MVNKSASIMRKIPIMKFTNLEKLRSLARGWGKTATGGDQISLLCCPAKKRFHAYLKLKVM